MPVSFCFSFRVQHRFKQSQTSSSKHHIVGEKQHDAELRRVFARKNFRSSRTIAINAGMDTGNSSSGNMISRLRVRNDIAAKNVPFTTSAQVPRIATGISCHAGPSTRRL